ncbi:transcriptional regulator, AsnC family protein [Streptomyces bingchenggensis BCW-1]|uniref:Transcriptional regulator, AsnC family protein n=1 Tax=Streptomyces bingchenggensis (strain BCW-1) TaxID=749414 RepID=D7C725_STRBB|nr:Lrp/AsnC family transcriptional regulator [Streptomyces bingchenggensis]ADI08412.1 transcriptional regulator, AsnC family protein [Streptomyces bingchenggensis BCW-1]
MNSDAFDELDRQLVQALQLDGRAPFSRIADVLGVSDQTVARRYTRLRTAGTIRVLGLTDPAALGEVVWLLRVQCTPDAAVSVAEAMARRSDTSWVSLMSGGTEISGITRAASGEDSDALLLRKLPSTPRVVGVAAHCVLHEYFGGPQGLVSKSGMLTPRQIERLIVPVRPPDGRARLDDGDRQLLAVLARDGRAGLGELAAATGWSQSTVRRRLAELRSDGTLYFDVDYHHRMFGHGSTAVLWLAVLPAHLAAAGQAVAEHPEAAFVCATTGPHNLLAVVVCRDVRHLYEYLTTRVAALPGVRGMETSPTIRRVKGAGPLLLPPRGAARRVP